MLETLRRSLDQLGSYPATAGLPQLRAACAAWLTRRYGLKDGSVDPDSMVLPVNGTREALFAFVQAAVDPDARTARGAAESVLSDLRGRGRCWPGAEPYFIDTPPAGGYQPDLAAVPEAIWRRCQVLFLCSPGNPSGAVLPLEFFSRALDLAERHDFIVASDECYADIYRDEAAPPPGLLEAAEATGRTAFERCVVFHSLSKRSSLPGAALRLRGRRCRAARALSPLPHLPRQRHAGADAARQHRRVVRRCARRARTAASTRRSSRACCRCSPRCSRISPPAGAFYLWAHVGRDDEAFARELYARQNITVLPGSYLARAGARGNPGAQRVRISLVPPLESVRGGCRADPGIPAMNACPVRDCHP